MTLPDQHEPVAPERFLTVQALNATSSRLLEKVKFRQMPQKDFPQQFGQVPSPTCTSSALSDKGRDSLPESCSNSRIKLTKAEASMNTSQRYT